jgi:hypothetical protein
MATDAPQQAMQDLTLDENQSGDAPTPASQSVTSDRPSFSDLGSTPVSSATFLASLERILADNREQTKELFNQFKAQKPRTKVYSTQPDIFSGSIGQEVERWLKQF